MLIFFMNFFLGGGFKVLRIKNPGSAASIRDILGSTSEVVLWSGAVEK